MSRPWMPLYVADYLADTCRLSTVEHGAYMLLIMDYWRNGGLPNDDKKLARIARMTESEWQEIRDNISELFQPEWKHKRIDEEIAKSDAKVERRSEAGRRGGLAKAARTSSNATILPEQTCSNALPSSSQSQSHSPIGENTRERVLRPLAEFESQFWPIYPNKVGKEAARKSWGRSVEKATVGEIMAGLRRYVAKTDDRPWCNPATWLNQGRWADEPAVPKANVLPFATGSDPPTKPPQISDEEGRRIALEFERSRQAGR